MLLLLFHINKNLYAIDTRRIVKVIPRVNLNGIPHVPDYVSGLLNYHGKIVPVIDLSKLMSGESCRNCLGTRIVLIHYSGEGSEDNILGLIAEGVTETIKISESEFSPSAISVKEAPYLAEFVQNNQELIQIIDVMKILPDSLKESLFTQ